ncbi:hypothetical protein BN77_1192 [Rhizobium mesoamericanum STM3625]|uniref:Uncharacterized protein n=1 Tax=Rhizobium mesoamericanum STM3625 TaxID=1211777 RepID=K0PBX9_9HYPH|nr:hypothetical protein BN77_1192 [Rhizobium mesoamericanum STM3625]
MTTCSPIDSLSPRAQNRIKAASDLWLARQRDYAVLLQYYDIVASSPVACRATSRTPSDVACNRVQKAIAVTLLSSNH